MSSSEQSKESGGHKWVVTFTSLVVMVATCIMVYIGFLQTRSSEATTKLALEQEQIKRLQARKEFIESCQQARLHWHVICWAKDNGTRAERAQIALLLYSAMKKVSDNYYLMAHPEEAQLWSDLTDDALDVQNYFSLTNTTDYYTKSVEEKMILRSGQMEGLIERLHLEDLVRNPK